MKIYKLARRKRKGGPKMQLRPHPSDREEIPMAEYMALFSKLMSKPKQDN